MRTSLPYRFLATLAAGAALSLALAEGASAQQQRPQGPAGGSTVLTTDLPNLIPTTLGLVLKNGGPTGWGKTKVIDQPSQVDSTQAGPQNNLCHIDMAAYRTFNKGDGDAGAFVTKTFVGATLAHTHNVPGGLASKDFIDWHQFSLNLAEGMNIVRVVFDANKQVAETDENNSFQVRVNVKLDCDGDGVVAGVTPPGGLKQAPGRPDPDPTQPRSLRLKPAN